MGEKLSIAQANLLGSIIRTADEHKNPGGVYVSGRERRTAFILQSMGLITFNRVRGTADPCDAGRSALSNTFKKEG